MMRTAINIIGKDGQPLTGDLHVVRNELKNYPFPILQLDTLARYLINNHGDIVKTDDLSLETVVDEAIKVMETLSSQQAVEDGQACMHCEDWTILPGTIYSYCPDCGRSLPPAA